MSDVDQTEAEAELRRLLEELEQADETVDRIRRSRNRAAYRLAETGVSYRKIGELADVSPERARQWAHEHGETIQ